VSEPATYRAVIVEADGGSRGNPGPAAYGAVLKDAETGAVIAEDGETIGRATNNVAEYSGLIAGLKLAERFAPEADIEVRMDSKLVVEQMSGRWKIKHPDMKPLATEANRLAPFGTTYTWVPREQNSHADRLANEALDGVGSGIRTPLDPLAEDEDELIGELESPAERPAATSQEQVRGWAPPHLGPPTTLVLVRHGVTEHTAAKRFSGGLASSNPGLSDEGRAQIRTTADWLSPLASAVDAVVASPVRRTMESAEILAEAFGHEIAVEPGFAEMEFGAWDGLTFEEVAEQDKAGLEAWIGSLDTAPEGGESFRSVQERVMATLDKVLAEHPGRTLVVVSHVTPIKTLVAHALDAPLEAIFRMELSPASVTVLSFFPEADMPVPRASLRIYNARPPGEDAFSDVASRW
jgi:ribonuclease H / adenosylcobalamin/alpha-ribazole phosphatase